MQNLPQDIHKGMNVYDSQHHHLGKVDDFKFAENTIDTNVEAAEIDGTDRRTNASLVDNLAQAFVGDELPEVLRDRLLTEGYIRIDSDGLFAADRYVLPSQIASAHGDEVMLNVAKSDLIKH